jgi:ABC-type phosphate transport system substrate-binding protein
MKAQSPIYCFATCALVLSCLVLGVSVSYPAIKNMAVVVAADSNLPDLTMAELTKLCKGAQKSWPDGRNFTLVLKDPASPEMHVAVQKLFGVSPADAKTAIAKINEVRPLIKIVGSDEDVFRTVTATPGAVGLVDVYSINSAVKVLHIDGKLPFDVGYALR